MGPWKRTLSYTHKIPPRATRHVRVRVRGTARERERERDGERRTESTVAREEHDRLLVDRGSEPVRAYVPLCERGELRYVLDADDKRVRVRVWYGHAYGGAVLVGRGDGGGVTVTTFGGGGGEVVQYAGEVARSCADV